MTGTHWATVIESASATIRLPDAVDDEALWLIGFTGSYGSTEADLKWSRLGSDKLKVESTAHLNLT